VFSSFTLYIILYRL